MTLLDQIASNQAAKEVVANMLFDAASPAMIWGRHGSACNGLTFGYYGGSFVDSTGTLHAIANGTVTLTASATNYLYADPTTGAVSVNTTGFPAGKVPLYQIVTGTLTATSYTDLRSYQPSATAASGGGTSSVMGASGPSHAAGLAPDPGATAGTTRYLREDGFWQVPVGSGTSGTLTALTDVNVTEAAAIDKNMLRWDNGTSRWIADPRAYDVAINFVGLTVSGEKMRIKIVRAVTLPASLTGSSADAGTAATASTVFTLKQNTTGIGTITFAAGATTGTFSFTSAVTFAAGDTFEIDAPATADTTLADIAFTFKGVW